MNKLSVVLLLILGASSVFANATSFECPDESQLKSCSGGSCNINGYIWDSVPGAGFNHLLTHDFSSAALDDTHNSFSCTYRNFTGGDNDYIVLKLLFSKSLTLSGEGPHWTALPPPLNTKICNPTDTEASIDDCKIQIATTV